MLFPKNGGTSLQCLGQVFFGSIKIPQILVNSAEVIQRFQGILMPFPEFFPPKIVSQSKSGFRFFGFVVTKIEICEVVDAGNGIGVLPPINLFVQFYDFFIIQFGTLKISLGFIKKGQIVQQCQGGGMFRSLNLFRNGVAFLEKGFRFIIKSLIF